MDATSLNALEELMTEFFAPETTNARKQQIEKTLEQFSRQPDSWKNCFLCIAGTVNPYVNMFCMTTLEGVISGRWASLPSTAREELRGALYRLCLERHRRLPRFLRNKAAKLLVDVARLAWPHEYPDFYGDVLQLVQQPETAPLGLLLLLTACEELLSPREDTSAARRSELRQLLLRQLPPTLAALTGILRSVLETNKSNTTATPPPSPEQPRSQRRPSGSMPQLTPSASTGSLLSTMLTSDGGEKNPFCSVLPLDGETTEVVALALKCLCQLFAWAPLSSTMTPELMTAIFHFASLGFSKEGSGSEDLDTSSSSSEPLGVVAVSCINEIMSKNCVPADSEAYMLQLFRHTFHLLQRLLDMGGARTEASLADVDPDYLSGLTEFLRLFVSLHLRRLEPRPQFPVLDLLALLFRYTLLQPSTELYYSCLDIWTVFLDHLSSKCAHKTENKEALMAKYQEAVLSLAGQTLQRTQFRRHASELEHLQQWGATEADSETETEWEELLRRSAEVLERAAALYPLHVRALLLTGWHETLQPYVSLASMTEATPGGRRLRLPPETDAARLYNCLRDLATQLYMLARLAPLLTEQGPDAGPLAHELVSAAAFGTAQRLHEVELPAGRARLRSALVEAHAESLAALRPWCHWMVAAQGGQITTSVQVEDLLREITVATCGAVQSRSPPRLVRAAVSTLLTITATVRSGALVDCPQIQQLYGRAGTLTLQKQDRILLYRALANLLLLPWLRAADQLWEERRRHLAVFLGSLTAEFRRLRQTPGLADSRELRDRAKPVIERTLSVLSEIVAGISGEVTKTKQLCYDCLQEAIRDALWVFTVFVHQPDTCREVLGFFLASFESLRTQMGAQFAEQSVQLFVQVFSRDDLARTLLEEGSAGCAALEKFLRLLRLIVSEPAAAFRRLLPAVLQLQLQRLQPLLAARATPELRLPLFELTAALLEYNWRFFFPSSVLKTLDGPSEEEEVSHEPQLLALLEAMGQSFLQTDLNVFRLNLQTLQTLNSKWKLYSKSVFRRLLLARFLTVLLQTLLARSHDLLRDEMTAAVYAMAAVDLATFSDSLLPTLLRDSPGLRDPQRAALAAAAPRHADLPSFAAELTAFVGDWRHYTLVNQSMQS